MPSARYFEILAQLLDSKMELFMLLNGHIGVEMLLEHNGMSSSIITFGWPQSVTRVKRNR